MRSKAPLINPLHMSEFEIAASIHRLSAHRHKAIVAACVSTGATDENDSAVPLGDGDDERRRGPTVWTFGLLDSRSTRHASEQRRVSYRVRHQWRALWRQRLQWNDPL